ncbi:MAG: hypothetical protein V9E99_08345 [Microthrixaceae bacterium]
MTPLVLTGTVVTFDDDRRVLRSGAVYVNDHGIIETVQSARRRAPAGYTHARRVATGATVYPGLIDLHNHLAYNTLPLWRAPRDTPYTTRYQWPGAATYGRDISNPATAYGEAAPAAALRYAEVKAVVGGTTAIQGSPPLTRAFPGWMVRNVEKEVFVEDGSGPAVKDRWRQSVLPMEPAALAKVGTALAAGTSFAYHLAEGTSEKLRSEYESLDAAGCIHPGLVGIHSTALSEEELAAWGAVGGTVVWSPFSNVWLYGDTTDVVAARAAGLNVCLGNDWSPSATRNLLGELKVAAEWNDRSLGGAFEALELCEMVTRNPGLTLERTWNRPVGRLVEGALADLAVLRRHSGDGYADLLAATEADVTLVIIGGRPCYGTAALVGAAGATSSEEVRVGRLRRRVVMSLPPELTPADPDLAAQANLSWAAGLAQLEAVRRDPGTAVRTARERKPRGVPAFRFVPDMAGPIDADGEARVLDDQELDTLVMPPLDPLLHDSAFFDRLDREAPAHAQLLRGLRARFR